MQGSYAEWASEASERLAQLVLESEPDLMERARDADGIVQGPAREMCRLATERVLNALSQRVVEGAREKGLRVHRRKRVQYFGLHGPIEVDSPYMYHASTGDSARPVKEELGITHQGRSRALERALTDFGAEESFGHAAERFAEHYGFPVDRTTVMRVTEAAAIAAEAFVQERLRSAADSAQGEADQLLIELDGCEIRTGTLEAASIPATTPIRGAPCRRRVEQWREVRVGLARQLDEVEPTYVAAMAPYPEVVSSLVDAAVSHGLSARTETIAVADGGNGLKEELEVQFPRLTFILDRHTCRSICMKPPRRSAWKTTHERTGCTITWNGFTSGGSATSSPSCAVTKARGTSEPAS